jgi:hypothetical protein
VWALSGVVVSMRRVRVSGWSVQIEDKKGRSVAVRRVGRPPSLSRVGVIVAPPIKLAKTLVYFWVLYINCLPRGRVY